MSVATSSISVPGGPVGPPAEPGPAAPAIASLPASPDHTTSPCTCVMSRRRADPGQRLPAAGAAGSQPSTRRNEPRHGHAAFRWRQVPRPLRRPHPRMTTISPCHVHQQLPALPANQDLGFPRSASCSHACSLNHETTPQVSNLSGNDSGIPARPETGVGRSMRMRLKAERYRKRTYGAEPVSYLLLAAACRHQP